MFEDLITNDWMQTAANFYNAFLNWFVVQPISAQIITVILIIIGFIGLGYLIYGSLWITYQAVKFSIVLTVLSIYLSFAFIVIFFTLIFDYKGVDKEWTKISGSVKSFVQWAYPAKESKHAHKHHKHHEHHGHVHKHVIVQQVPVQQQRPAVVIIQEKKGNGIEAPQAVQNNQNAKVSNLQQSYAIPKQRIVQDDFDEDLDEDLGDSEVDVKEKQKMYCPNCGTEFTPRMTATLAEKSFTFCEACGEKFFRRNMDPKVQV